MKRNKNAPTAHFSYREFCDCFNTADFITPYEISLILYLETVLKKFTSYGHMAIFACVSAATQ